ncbi:MSHA biogenesis protein MshQ [Shewanella sediminis HAW-EB3]|uniref:MSHA biogenesis protein MshQ n=1 Tax=Shewanella sediminis (strain HAW-EB3) TaxID=425104 RepID=A8FQP6_SHESH|nr:DUF6701 domain-containing protein [Shewanella sediminis]ABV35169.1 MSHA biogenesis protein MshQ [Shewanella sediminis HAW-EB3]
MFKIVLSLALLFPALAIAVPYCSDIFTDPPTGDHGENGLTPPANIGPPLGDLNCTRKRGCDNSTSGYFLPGDYSFSEGNFHGGGPSLVNHITTNGTTARLYFDRVSLSGVSLNTYGKAEDLIIYVREDLTIAGHNHINGIIYVVGNVSLTGNGSVTGGLAAGGSAGVGGNGDFVFDEEAIDNADFGGMCIPGPKPDLNHYRLEFSSGALSCKAKDILIRACADEYCATETSVLSSVDLTKNGGVYSTVNFAGHTVPAAELWHADGGTVLVGLGATAPSAPYRCFIDGLEVANIADCQLTFEDTGFYFDAPDTISYKDSGQFELFAATKDPVTQKCESLFKNQTKSVDFSFNYKDPNPVNNPASLMLTAPTQSKVIAGGDTESVSVKFDAEGKALLTVNYPEAGEVTLKASHTHTVNTPNGSEELVLEHQDSFVAKPAGFHFFNESANNRCASSDPYDADCKVLAKAGESFDMRLKAAGWTSDEDSDFSDNPVLQNFKHSNIQIQAAVEAPSLADGGTNGSFSTSAVDFNLSGSESSQLISQSWTEVGTLTAKLTQDISYLGVTISKDNASSELFGRFTPAYLDISGNSPSLTHSCGSFTYIDQPFGFSGGGEPIIQVRGMASDDSEARNYQLGDWWRYKHKEEASRNQWLGRGYEDKTGELQVQDSEYPGLSGSVSYANNANTATLTGAKVEYVRLPTPMVPFDAKFDLKLAVTDLTDEDGICYQADSSGSCQPFSFEDIADGASFELRYGRLQLDNGYSPQSESLRLPLRTEYVSAVDAANVPTWVTNGDDSCSVYNTVTSTDTTEAVTTGMNMTLPAGFPAITAHSNDELTSQSGTALQGVNHIYFTAPNTPGEVRLKQHVEPWLKWYWNYDGNKPNALYDPRASAFFGTYRGHDKVIYWHEVN